MRAASFLRFVAWSFFILGLLVLAGAAAIGLTVGMIPAMMIFGGTTFTWAVLIAFASMAENIARIREATEEQLDMLREPRGVT